MPKNTVTIPAELIPEFEAWGQMTARLFGRLRQQKGLIPKGTPKDQEWFWSKEWQEGEREADEALAKGDFEDFDNVEDLIANLQKGK